MQNREIKTEEEISLIVKSAEIIDNVFDRVLNSIKVGQTEIEIAEFIFKSVIELGGEGLSFDTIVAFGENGKAVRSVSELPEGTGFRLMLSDGTIAAQAKKKEE